VPGARIIIADNKDGSRKALKQTLVRVGFNVQAEVRNIPETLRKCRTLFPDLLIIDANLEGGSVLELAGIIEFDNIASVVILTDENNMPVNDYVHVIKPYTDETIISVVEVCIHFNTRVSLMRKEVDRLKEDLNIRKLVEEAKGILMKKFGLDEAKAYRKIQKESMNTGIPIKEIARTVIAAYETDKKKKKSRD